MYGFVVAVTKLGGVSVLVNFLMFTASQLQVSRFSLTRWYMGLKTWRPKKHIIIMIGGREFGPLYPVLLILNPLDIHFN